MGIDRAGARDQQPFAIELVDVEGIGRGEDIEWRRVFDLLCELGSGGETEDRVDAGFRFEDRPQGSEGFRQICGCRHHDFGLGLGRGDGREQHEEKSSVSCIRNHVLFILQPAA